MALSLLPPDVIVQSHCFHLCSSPGSRGRMGVWWLHRGRSPLQAVAHQRLTGFQPITLGQPNNPDSSLISHPRHTDHLSPGSDDSMCITWLVFLPFSLPLPASVFVQECLHAYPGLLIDTSRSTTPEKHCSTHCWLSSIYPTPWPCGPHAVSRPCLHNFTHAVPSAWNALFHILLANPGLIIFKDLAQVLFL